MIHNRSSLSTEEWFPSGEYMCTGNVLKYRFGCPCVTEEPRSLHWCLRSFYYVLWWSYTFGRNIPLYRVSLMYQVYHKCTTSSSLVPLRSEILLPLVKHTLSQKRVIEAFKLLGDYSQSNWSNIKTKEE